MNFTELTKGEILKHHLHGNVKFISFNFGTCEVLKYDLILYFDKNGKIKQKYGWKQITVKTNLLSK